MKKTILLLLLSLIFNRGNSQYLPLSHVDFPGTAGIELWDLMGEKIVTRNKIGSGENIVLPAENYSSGTYLLRWSTNEKSITTKVVVLKQ